MRYHVNEAPSFAQRDVTQSRLPLYLIIDRGPGLNGQLALLSCKLPPVSRSYRILLHISDPREHWLMHDDPIMSMARLHCLDDPSHNEQAPPGEAKSLGAGVVCSRQRKLLKMTIIKTSLIQWCYQCLRHRGCFRARAPLQCKLPFFFLFLLHGTVDPCSGGKLGTLPD